MLGARLFESGILVFVEKSNGTKIWAVASNVEPVDLRQYGRQGGARSV
jgi:hypothetical protein